MPSLTRSLALTASSLLFALPLGFGCSPSATPDDAATGGTGASSGSAGQSAGGAPAGGTSGRGAGGAGGVSATGGASGGGAPPGAGAGGVSGAGGVVGTGAVGGALASGGAGAGVGGALAGSAGVGGGAGSGATAGQGGAAGSSVAGGGGSAGQAGSAGSGGSTATGFFMDDFEAGTAGMQPPGWDNLIAYNKNGANPSGSTLALTDTMHVHGGTKAVHFHGDSNPAQLVRALDSGMSKLYVRVWVYMTRKLGQQTDMGMNHETLIALRRVTGGVNDEVRFGEIKGTVGVNEVPSDNIAPTQDKWHMATGPLLPAATWVCLEVAFLADASPNTLQSFMNDAPFFAVTSVAKDQWQNMEEPANWIAQKFSGSPSEVVIGWQSFSGSANDVWMDDLILSTAPIGCN